MTTTESGLRAAAWPAAVPPLPRLWIGFMLALCYLAGEIYARLAENRALLVFLRVVIGLGAGWEWLFCVHRYHAILRQIAPRLSNGSSSYPVSPGDAVGYHFLPLYNVYWLFHWPSVLSGFLNDSGIQTTSGALSGLLILLSCGVLWLDGGIGFALLFACLLSFAGPIRQAVLQYEQRQRAVKVFS